MDISSEVTVMGRVLEPRVIDKVKEPLARFIQSICDSSTVFVADVKHMIPAVIAQADGAKVHRFNILDHGSAEGVMIGKDWITVNNFEKHAPFLSKLRPLFTTSAKIHLGHCDAGQNTDLMYLFAITFGAKVYAGTGMDAGAPYSFNLGDYVGVTPAGTVFKEMRRP